MKFFGDAQGRRADQYREVEAGGISGCEERWRKLRKELVNKECNLKVKDGSLMMQKNGKGNRELIFSGSMGKRGGTMLMNNPWSS